MEFLVSATRFADCRGILFDLDGTLVDSYGPIAESLNHALSVMGFPALPCEQIRRMVGRGLEVLVAQTAGERHVEQGIRLFRARYREIFLAGTEPMPGVLETVPALSRRGYRMAVVTNKPSYFSKDILGHLKLLSCLPVVYGPDCVPNAKPSPDMVERALSDIGVAPAQAALVGDMEIDVETARAAGLSTVVIPTGSRTRDELALAGPDAILERFEELLDLFPGR